MIYIIIIIINFSGFCDACGICHLLKNVICQNYSAYSK